MEQIKTIRSLRAYVTEKRRTGSKIAFVPTMGALHEGHLELVRQGLKQAGICIPYIFLNPKQFGDGEDLDSYPKTLETDLDKLEKTGAQAVYVPSAADIYPPGFSTTVSVKGISEILEGAHRPHFFDGVATIVTKMLLQCLPDIALFGEKDYQQLLVIQKLVTDLNIPVQITGVPTVRDENGLALSSRNTYLSEAEYGIAIQLNKILAGMKPGNDAHAAHEKLKAAGFDKIDYCTICDAHTLLPPEENTQEKRALAAVWIGKTRLIDNLPVSE